MKLLLIFLDETDTWKEIPLYEAIVRRLRKAGVDGATVNAGIMGYGRARKLHKKGLFGVTDERPVTISVVDEENKLRPLLPELRSMVKEGVLALLEAEIIE